MRLLGLFVLLLSLSLSLVSADCGAELPTDEAAAGSEGMCMAPPIVTHAAVDTHVTPSSPALARILSRGRLICAHCDDTLGHSKVLSNTSATGMEPELCAGLAAALGVEPSYWMMRTPSERFPLLQGGEVDLAFALTSKTVQRDMFEKGAFSQ